SAVSSVTSPLLSATLNGVGKDFSLTLNPPAAPSLTSLACVPATFTPPGTSTCTVTLSANALSATAVALTSGNAAVTVPTTVNVASGSKTGTFKATASAAVRRLTSPL